jgi:hypothetical protein
MADERVAKIIEERKQAPVEVITEGGDDDVPETPTA